MREAHYSMIYTKYPRVTALTLTMMMFAQCGEEGKGEESRGVQAKYEKE